MERKHSKLGLLNRTHKYLLANSRLYERWDKKPYKNRVHFAALFIYGLISIAAGYYFTFYSQDHFQAKVMGSLKIPAITFPTDGSILNSKRPTLTWDAVSGANSYKVKLYQDDTLLRDTTVNTNSYTPDFDLADKGNYYWRVQALYQSASIAEAEAKIVGAIENLFSPSLTANAATGPTAAQISPRNGEVIKTNTAGIASVNFASVVNNSSPSALYSRVMYRKVGNTKWNSFGTSAVSAPSGGTSLPNNITGKYMSALGWSCEMGWGSTNTPGSCNYTWTNGTRTARPAWAGYKIYTPAITLTPGTYEWTVAAKDGSRYSSTWPTPWRFTVTTPPPAGQTITAQSDLSAFWNFSIDLTRSSNFIMPDLSHGRSIGAYYPESPSSFPSFDAQAGKKHPIAIKFKSFYWDANFPADIAKTYHDQGRQFVLTWEQWNANAAGTPQEQFANTAVVTNKQYVNATGQTIYFDDYINNWASQIKSYKKPVYIRLAHEMNSVNYPWGANTNGNTPQTYVAMWQHVHNVFSQAGVKNVRWVWCPNNEPLSSLTSYYPGDNYVDVVAIDGYNWGNTKSWSTWRSFKTIFDGPYTALAGLTTKDIWIVETSSQESGGSKAAWISDAYNYARNYYPRLKALMWFDNTSWAIDTSDAALNAYKSAVQSY